MRIYQNAMEALRETERDLWEMGIDTHPASMQSKRVGSDSDYETKELTAYGFQILGHSALGITDELKLIEYLVKDGAQATEISRYIAREFSSRFMSAEPSNPGPAYLERLRVWKEFLKEDGKFHYTYSERTVPQMSPVLERLAKDNDSRQCIIQIFDALDRVSRRSGDGESLELRWELGQDQEMASGVGRIPCSMYYQLMVRNNKVELIYTMRSCDLLTHFVIDFILALNLQAYAVEFLNEYSGAATPYSIGKFTYFTGSLHAYRKDMRARGIF